MITKELIEDAKAVGISIKMQLENADEAVFYVDSFCDLDDLSALVELQLQRQRERQAVTKLHAASYEHNGKQYALTLEGSQEEVHAHAMRLGFTVDGVIVHQEVITDAAMQEKRL